jgi:hypothetical protein
VDRESQKRERRRRRRHLSGGSYESSGAWWKMMQRKVDPKLLRVIVELYKECPIKREWEGGGLRCSIF